MIPKYFRSCDHVEMVQNHVRSKYLLVVQVLCHLFVVECLVAGQCPMIKSQVQNTDNLIKW